MRKGLFFLLLSTLVLQAQNGAINGRKADVSANKINGVVVPSNLSVLATNNQGQIVQTTVAVILGGYEVGAEDASSALVTNDLTSHSFIINSSKAAVLNEASCVTDSGSQSVTVKIGSTTLFTITCVANGSYSAGTTNGTTGYMNAAAMSSTTIASHAQLDLSGTANGTTKDLKLFIYATR